MIPVIFALFIHAVFFGDHACTVNAHVLFITTVHIIPFTWICFYSLMLCYLITTVYGKCIKWFII